MDKLDTYDNLILLCKADHKLIDDHPQLYTIDRLRQVKREHEQWVDSRLSSQSTWPKISVAGGPDQVELERITSGTELVQLRTGAFVTESSHPDPKQAPEAELLASFFQELEDCEVLKDLGPAEHVRFGFSLTERLDDLLGHGFVVYAARVVRTLNVDTHRLPWPIVIVQVVRLEDALEPEGVASE